MKIDPSEIRASDAVSAADPNTLLIQFFAVPPFGAGGIILKLDFAADGLAGVSPDACPAAWSTATKRPVSSLPKSSLPAAFPVEPSYSFLRFASEGSTPDLIASFAAPTSCASTSPADGAAYEGASIAGGDGLANSFFVSAGLAAAGRTAAGLAAAATAGSAQARGFAEKTGSAAALTRGAGT